MQSDMIESPLTLLLSNSDNLYAGMTIDGKTVGNLDIEIGGSLISKRE